MFRRNRTPKPVPARPTAEALTLGLRILADDRAAGDDWALEFFNDGPFDDDVANYPTSWVRKLRIFHLGKPGPGDIPWEAIELPADYEIPAEFLRPRGDSPTKTQGDTYLMRFLTLGGATVAVESTRFVTRWSSCPPFAADKPYEISGFQWTCAGCGAYGREGDTYHDPNYRRQQEARDEANAHAEKCRAFPAAPAN
ncbi:hypothetical protein [Streptomyces angustmyceticus]|uniref:hypothetical protein n=1 Tax=Streptomyces angustmyceticus TaxID=285578 RepID=UPI00344B1B79